MLSCTLRGSNIIFKKLIASLAAEYRVPIGGCNGVADVRLTAESVSAVFRLPVDGVTRNANGFLQNSNAALVLAGVGVGGVNGSGNVRFPAPRMGIG